MNLYDASKRAHVLEPTLLNALKPELEAIKPLPAVVNQSFIAANQSDRIDNTVTGTNREMIDHLRRDIQAMRAIVDKVVVLWTANTEMMYQPEMKTSRELLAAVDENKDLPSSILYAIAAIEEQVLYLNGSPQNTLMPAMVSYAAEKGGFVAGSDFKSG
jgi:myo-inositol-1-phosphate synthase